MKAIEIDMKHIRIFCILYMVGCAVGSVARRLDHLRAITEARTTVRAHAPHAIRGAPDEPTCDAGRAAVGHGTCA